MPTDGLATAPVPATLRSSVSNGTRLLAGVDGRSSSARRYRDLVASYSEKFGGVANLTDSEMAMIRHAAALTIRSESLHASIVRGEDVDDEELVRLTNALQRTLDRLGTAAPKNEAGLSAYLAKREAAA